MSGISTPWPEACLVLTDCPRDVFTDAELRYAAELKLPKRRDEWLLSRAAAKRLAVSAGLTDDPTSVSVDRPHLLLNGTRTDWFVSLSHSGRYAAAAIARRPVGIDIQTIRELSEDAAHLFLTDPESDEMRRCSLPHRILHFWSAKEAAWKQRLGAVDTLKQVQLALMSESADGLRFQDVETAIRGDFILALTATS